MGSTEPEDIAAPHELDRVPRSEAEEAQLLEGRQDGWEYLLFAAVLRRRTDDLEPKWRDHEARTREPGAEQLTEPEAVERLTHIFDRPQEILRDFERIQAPEVQEPAFGKLGEVGDERLITELAEGWVACYSGFLDWSADLRSLGVPEKFRAAYDVTSQFVDLPLQEFRDFVDHSVSELDRLPNAIREQQPISLRLVLKLTLDPELQKQSQVELDRIVTGYQGATTALDAQAALLEGLTADIERARAQASQRGFGNRHARKAAEQFIAAVAQWKAERDACEENLALVQGFTGDAQSSVLVLKSGEAVFATITGAALVEDRAGPGQWQGRSSGFSFPVGSIGGRSIRYRTGQSRGHFVQGAPIATAIDTGTLSVTNRRVVFQGAKQTRECLFDKLVGFQHTPDGSTIFSVSNRQKPTTVHYGANLAGWFDLRFDLALAHFRNDLPALVGQVEADLSAIDDHRPTSPA